MEEYDKQCIEKLESDQRRAVNVTLQKIEDKMKQISQGSPVLTKDQFDKFWNGNEFRSEFVAVNLFGPGTMWSLTQKSNNDEVIVADLLLIIQLASWFACIVLLSPETPTTTITASSAVAKEKFVSNIFRKSFGSDGTASNFSIIVKQDVLAKLTADGVTEHEAATSAWDKIQASSSGEVSLASFVSAMLELLCPPVVVVNIHVTKATDSDVAVKASLISGAAFDVTVLDSTPLANVENTIRTALAIESSATIRFMSSSSATLKPEQLLKDLIEDADRM